jgi:predicted DNA-binding transcriptional regulator YafY
MASLDLLLHPVRLRIVQALLGNRTLTTAQLADELGDVPTGTLYRQIALLSQADVLQVASERPVRGAVERSYSLRVEATKIDPAELATMTTDEHANMFRAFVAGLLADYDRYLSSGIPDLIRDGAGYTIAGLWMSDAEFAEFARDLQQVFQSRLDNQPGEGRRRRIVASIIIPDREGDRREQRRG